MKPPVGTRVAFNGQTGIVKAHRPGSMVDVLWDGRDYDMRTDAKSLTVIRENPGTRGGLTPRERASLPESSFALSGRRFPINDRRHAIIAMQYILRGFVKVNEAPEVLQAIYKRYPPDDPKNSEIWAFFGKHREKLMTPRTASGKKRAKVLKVAANPADDVYDPAKEQFRAVVQGVYESLVRKELGKKYDEPFVQNARGRRLDAALPEEKKRELLSRSYAIATRQGQKHGWLEEGTQEPTARGRSAAMKRLSEQQHAGENRQDYERTLASVRKSGHFRVVTEEVNGQTRFIVQPRPPKDLVKIPEYRVSLATAQEDAKKAEKAFRSAPASLRARANPFYVQQDGSSLTTVDLPDGDDTEILEQDTLTTLSERTGISPDVLRAAGVLDGEEPGEIGQGMKRKSGSLRQLTGKKLRRAPTVEAFEASRAIIDTSFPEGDARRVQDIRPTKGAETITFTVQPGTSIADLVQSGVSEQSLTALHETMANQVVSRYDFNSSFTPPVIREVIYPPIARFFVGEKKDAEPVLLAAQNQTQYAASQDLREKNDLSNYETTSPFTRRGWALQYGQAFQAAWEAYELLQDYALYIPRGEVQPNPKILVLTNRLLRLQQDELPRAGDFKGYIERQIKAVSEELESLKHLQALQEELSRKPEPSIEALGEFASQFVYSTEEPERFQQAPFSELANRPPPQGRRAVDILGAYPPGERAQVWKAQFRHLRIPLIIERFLLLSPSAIRLAAAAGAVGIRSALPGPRWIYEPGMEQAVPPFLRSAGTTKLSAPPKAQTVGALRGKTPPAKRFVGEEFSTKDQYTELETEYQKGRAVPATLAQGDEMRLRELQLRAVTAERTKSQAEARLRSLRSALRAADEAEEWTLSILQRDIGREESLISRETDVLKAARAEISRIKAMNIGDLYKGLPTIADRVFKDVVDAAYMAARYFDLNHVLSTSGQSALSLVANRVVHSDGSMTVTMRTGNAAIVQRKITSPPFYKFATKAERDSFVESVLRPAAHEQGKTEESTRDIYHVNIAIGRAEKAREAFQKYLSSAGVGKKAITYDAFKIGRLGGLYTEGVELERQMNGWLQGLRELVASAVLSAEAKSHGEAAIAELSEPIGVKVLDPNSPEYRTKLAQLRAEYERQKAEYDRVYATEAAQGKHDGKIRGLSADRKSLPSDQMGEKLAILEEELADLDPTFKSTRRRTDPVTQAARLRLSDFAKPVWGPTEQEYLSSQRPVALREGHFDVVNGVRVWFPATLVPIDGKKAKKSTSGPSALERFLDRAEIKIEKAMQAAASLPIVMVQEPSQVSSFTISCSPLPPIASEAVPALYKDPQALLGGVSPTTPVIDDADKTMVRVGHLRVPDAVMAFLYYLDAGARGVSGSLMERMRAVFGSPIAQEMVRQALGEGDANKMAEVNRGYKTWVTNQQVVFRFARPDDILALANSGAAEEMSLKGRGFPMAVYLYAGMDVKTAREFCRNLDTLSEGLDLSLAQRAVLAAKLLVNQKNLMQQYPRFPHTSSVLRQEDGTPAYYIRTYPPTPASVTKEAEKYKYSIEQTRSILRQDDPGAIQRMAAAKLPLPEAQPSYPLTAAETEEARIRREAVQREFKQLQDPALKAERVRAMQREGRLNIKEVAEEAAFDITSNNAFLVRADAMAHLAEGEGSENIRLAFMMALGRLRLFMEESLPKMDRSIVDELDTLANTGSEAELEEALSRLQSLGTQIREQGEKSVFEDIYADLQSVISRAKAAIDDPDFEAAVMRTSRRIGKARSTPMPASRSMSAEVASLPPVFWDIEHDFDGNEQYVLYVNTRRYRTPIFARTVSGELLRETPFPGNLVRPRPGVGGGIESMGERSEIAALRQRLADAEARSDKSAMKDIKRQLAGENRKVRRWRDAMSGSLSDLVVAGTEDPIKQIMKRLSFYSPVTSASVSSMSEQQKAYHIGMAKRLGRDPKEYLEEVSRRQLERAAVMQKTSKAEGFDRLGNRDRSAGWVYDQKGTKFKLRQPAKKFDVEAGTYERFGFELANYARFVTLNPYVFLATVKYWDAPNLVKGGAILLPGGMTVILDGVFTADPDQPMSAAGLPSDPTVTLTETIEQLKTAYADAVRSNDTVRMAQISKALYGEKLGRGGNVVPGLIAITNKLHSSASNYIPARTQHPYLSPDKKFAIEGPGPVTLGKERPEVQPVQRENTVIGQMMSLASEEAKRQSYVRGILPGIEARKQLIGTNQTRGPTHAKAIQAFQEEDQVVEPMLFAQQPTSRFAAGQTVKILVGPKRGTEGTVKSVSVDAGGTNIVVTLPPSGYRKDPLDVAFSGVTDTMVEIVGETAGEEPRRPSVAEVRQAQAARAEAARPAPAPTVEAPRAAKPKFTLADVLLTSEGQLVAVEGITKKPNGSFVYDVTLLDPDTGEAFMDAEGELITDTVKEESLSLVPSDEEASTLQQNPRPRRNSQHRGRLYVASRNMPLVVS